MTTTLADIQAAAQRIQPSIVRTPLELSVALSDARGAEVWLKLECFQRTGSFKIRGALNRLLALTNDERQAGVVTASAGNHGLGVAWAARATGTRATVVVPETGSPAKIAALRHSGAELLLHGPNYDAAEERALSLAASTGAVFVSAYDDDAVIAGGGTVGLEVLADLPGYPGIGVCVVPVGGGGLISGLAIALKGAQPSVTVLGVQSVASPALQASLAAGHVVQVPVEDSLADGLAGNVDPRTRTLGLMRQHVDRVELVEESAIADAMRFLMEHEHVLVEGAAAVGVALVLGGGVPPELGPAVVVVTGRNVSSDVLRAQVFSGSLQG